MQEATPYPVIVDGFVSWPPVESEPQKSVVLLVWKNAAVENIPCPAQGLGGL